MNNKLAFYYDSMQMPADSIIENLKKYLFTQNKYDDFVIFTDIMFPTNTEYGLFPTFYAKFFNGTIVVFDTDNYQYNKNNWLYIHDMQSFDQSSLNHKYNLIIYDESTEQKYRMVNYNELQQSL